MQNEQITAQMVRDLKDAEAEARNALAEAQRAYDAARLRRTTAEKAREQALGEVFLPVTDHAVVRYSERVIGIDVEHIKANMVPKSIGKAMALLDAKGRISLDGYAIIVRDGKVVTVTTRDDQEQ